MKITSAIHANITVLMYIRYSWAYSHDLPSLPLLISGSSKNAAFKKVAE